MNSHNSARERRPFYDYLYWSEGNNLLGLYEVEIFDRFFTERNLSHRPLDDKNICEGFLIIFV